MDAPQKLKLPRPLTESADAKVPWPVDQPATSLGINYVYLKRVVGNQLFDNPNPSTWDLTKKSQVDLCIQTGLRNFYNALVLPGETYSHEWSFLRPTKRLQTTSGQWTYDLPPGFAMFEGPIAFDVTAAALFPSIPITSDNNILRQRQIGESAGRPQMAAYRVKPNDSTGTRYELLLWPTPDGAYDMLYKYSANPELLKSDQDVPLGGQSHAQTIIEACLEAADDMRGVVGQHGTKFRERLRASISHDRRVASVDTLGYGRDNSDHPIDPYAYPNFHNCSEQITTYNGQIIG